MDPTEDAAYSSLLAINESHVYLLWERAGYRTISGLLVRLHLPLPPQSVAQTTSSAAAVSGTISGTVSGTIASN